MEEDVLLHRKVDARADLVELLGPVLEVDRAGHRRSRAVADQIHPIEDGLAADDPEPRRHAGREGLVRLDLDGSVRERGSAAVVVQEVAAIQRDPEVRATVLQGVP